MDVKTEWANALDAENARPPNIPNAQTQAAMRDTDAWVIEMRAKESQNIQLNASSYFETFTLKICL